MSSVERVKAFLAAAGIDIQVKEMDRSTRTAELRRGPIFVARVAFQSLQ